MPSIEKDSKGRVDYRALWARWWPLLLGLAAVFFSSWVRFAVLVWPEPEYSHAPLVIAMAGLLAWRRRAAFAAAPATNWSGARALLCYGPSALFYVFAVWVQSGLLETVAEILLLAGALAQMGGLMLVRAMAVPMILLLLSAPLPGNAIASATNELKQWVSASAESLLYAAGFPVARSGVTITIGSYRMLVAEACSGMNSLFSLAAVGLFYLFLVPRARVWQTALVATAIMPLAITANVIRVMILVLITYYLGDEAGQGFLHEFAGFSMFLTALLGLVGLDAVLNRLGRSKSNRTAPLDSVEHG